jgi:alkyldihydroxyacetonephosphate synthase
MWDIIRTELEDVAGVENVDTDIANLITHGNDGFWTVMQLTTKGQIAGLPDIVVRPGSTQEVSRILVIANYYKIPVIPVGGVSGAQGGITPVKGGIALDMKRMNKVVEFDEMSRTVTVETGMNFQQLEWIANERGYSLMHYPSSITCSTVGGLPGA